MFGPGADNGPRDAMSDVVVGEAESAWATVHGQPAAVARLAAAAVSPMHAYMLVGPRGSGKRAAALAFAGEVLVAADERAEAEQWRAQRHRERARRAQHPDVFVLDPEGNQLRREVEASTLIAESSRSPVEGRRKVLIVNRFHTAVPAAAASLLKPIEEPPGPVVWVLLCEQVLPEHVTVESRCVRVDFNALSAADIEAALLSERLVEADAAPAIAAAAGGDLNRARLLAADSDVLARRDMWHSIPTRLNGTGATVVTLVDDLRQMIDKAAVPLQAKHQEEIEALSRREKDFGTRGSGRTEIEARHRRELRQLRTDELRFGLATLAQRYRSAITEHTPEGAEQTPAVTTDAALSAIDRIRETAASLIRNPNEPLALQALLVDLPTPNNA